MSDPPTGPVDVDGPDGCDLCDLPTPDPPVTDEDVPGAYCCQGCLAVAGTLDAPTETDIGDAREAVRAERREPVPDEAETAFVRVEGMHCTSCEAFLESRAEGAPGVHRAEASYAAELVRVAYDPDELGAAGGDGGDGGDERAGADERVAALLDAPGYRARPADGAETDDSESLGRLLVGGFLGMMVMAWYVLFLYPTYLGLPSDALLLDVRGSAGGYLLWNVWAFSTIVLGYTGAPVLRGALVSLRAGRPNMDLLVATAAVTAYLYSTAVLLTSDVDVYFDVSVVVLVAVTVGGYYERRIRRRAADRLADLTTERVETARRAVDDGGSDGSGGEAAGDGAGGAAATETVPVDEVATGDRLVVEPGERLPTDGTVVDGRAGVDESLVTGEAAPRRVGPGDEVLGGALVTDGTLRVESDGTSTVERLAHHLWDVQAATPGAQRVADRVAAVFVPLVVVVAALAFGATLLTGGTATGALLTGLAVLVVSCPCAMGLATPLAVAAGVRDALDRGVVVTDPSVFETAVDADTVVLDKTGTLTESEPSLVERAGDHEALRRAAAVERRADHPIAGAVVDAVDAPPAASGFRTHPGHGVSAVVEGDRVHVGDAALFEGLDGDWSVPDACRTCYEAGDERGIAAYVGWDGAVRGALVAAERPREGWEAAVEALGAGRRVVVLTGDDRAAAESFASHPAVDEVFAGVPPAGKAETVERLRKRGTVVMVGDGSNDAPALAAADLGVALRSGTALAADAADAVVTDGGLDRVPAVFDLTTGTRRRVRENLGWALCYNAVAVPAAALGLLSPLLAAVAMATSSLLVVANSTRPVLDSEARSDGRRRGSGDDHTGESDPGGPSAPTRTLAGDD
ncbi:heavy metal translocating P-type ATPase [Haloglomus litoreum]|uniref:heavy metal translocating P-type ATPase n=1 Tax=Haloglomus litoreum TaxID=3034026 RepID=UPI0023E8A900|nr:cation-translocating P-type ATPase [Haloglomus sp. DT116]